MNTAITIALIICSTILLIVIIAAIMLFRLIKQAEMKWDELRAEYEKAERTKTNENLSH